MPPNRTEKNNTNLGKESKHSRYPNIILEIDYKCHQIKINASVYIEN